MSPQVLALNLNSLQSPIDRASDAVGRGNKKVFEEIGYEFARFYQTCFTNIAGADLALDLGRVADFREALRTGDPPDGQEYLRRAFNHYAQAVSAADGKTRAELLLLANIEIGFHEQTRLQPEIAESMDAGLVSFLDFARPIFRAIFPARGLFHLAHLYLMRLLGRPTALDLAIRGLLDEVRVLLRQVITETMMTIALPSGVVLRLGDDLQAGFPEPLKEITNQELGQFLKVNHLEAGNLAGSGAIDWAELPDRLHFILDLFRCYQEQQNLFDPPFNDAQVEAMNAGRVPEGRL